MTIAFSLTSDESRHFAEMIVTEEKWMEKRNADNTLVNCINLFVLNRSDPVNMLTHSVMVAASAR